MTTTRTHHSKTASEIVEFLSNGTRNFYFGVIWTGSGYNVCNGHEVAPANANSVNKLIRSGDLIRKGTGRGWTLPAQEQ